MISTVHEIDFTNIQHGFLVLKESNAVMFIRAVEWMIEWIWGDKTYKKCFVLTNSKYRGKTEDEEKRYWNVIY